MLHTKFPGNQPAGFGEDFEGFLPYIGVVTSIISSDFHFLVPESFHTKFGSDQYSSF